MCGIIGYIGNKNATQVILDGLKKLEYRGYDSAGIAVLNGNGFSVCKEKGKISQLIESLNGGTFEGNSGIGHTRWATHGEPNKTNAHPHLDCTSSVAIAHNGIIENHHDLREKLSLKGHTFKSDTDSEVITHLIEDYKGQGFDLLKSIRLALKDLQGTYALVIMDRDYPKKLFAARNGSPLIIGLGNNENLVASDIPALLKYTRKVLVLDDYQIVEASSDEVNVFDLEGTPKHNDFITVDWSLKEAQKGGFPHFMLKEIYEQPLVLKKIFDHYVDKKTLKIKFDEVFLGSLNLSSRKIKNINKIIIQACGTSFHAGLLAKYLFSVYSGISVDIDISSEFRYRPIITSPDTLVLSITQSGETTDTLMALRQAKLHKLKTLSICNVVGSTIARESDAVIYIHAGPEIGVASTKAYTAQMLIFYLLAIYLGEKKGLISPQLKENLLSQLENIPKLLGKILPDNNPFVACADKFYQTRDFLYLARNLNFPNALEGALKLKEIAYVHASAHPAGEMKHGPIALIDKDVCVVCIATCDSVYEKMLSNIQEVKARKGKIIAIATEGNFEIRRYCDEVIYVPKVEKEFYPLLVAVPLQLFAYYLARERGCEIDQPRNLAKSVTVE